MSGSMVMQSMVIEMLPLSSEQKAIHFALGALAIHNHAEILLGQTGAENEGDRQDVRALFGPGTVRQIGAHAGFLTLQADIAHSAVVQTKDLDRAVGIADAVVRVDR